MVSTEYNFRLNKAGDSDDNNDYHDIDNDTENVDNDNTD